METVDREPTEVLKEALDRHHPRIALACSFQVEDLVVLDGRPATGREAARVRTFLDLVADEARGAAQAALRGPEAALRRELECGGLSPYVAAARWGRR